MAANKVGIRSRRRPVVKNPLSPVVESVFATPQGKLYPVFNGTTHYATIPEWGPVSASWSLCADVEYHALAGTTQAIIAAGTGVTYLYVNSGGGFQAQLQDATATSKYVSAGNAVVGERTGIRLDVFADHMTMTNRRGSSSTTAAAFTNLSFFKLGGLAATWSGGFKSNLTLYSACLTDRTPLQGARFMPGNTVNTRAGQIPPIVFTGDGKVSFWAIVPAAGTNIVCGRSDNDRGFMSFNATAMSINLTAAGSAISFPHGGAAGQHMYVEVEFLRPDTLNVWFDGVLQTGTHAIENTQFNRIYNKVNAYADTTIADLTFKDLSTGQEWIYSNRNDSGNVLVNSNGGTAEGEETAIPADTSSWSGTSGSRTLTNLPDSVQVVADSTSAYTVAHTLTGLTVGEHLRIRMNIERGTNTGTLSVRIAPDPLFGAPVVTDDYTSPNSPGEVEYIIPVTGTTMYIGVRSSGHAVGETLFIREASTQSVTHGLWYEGSTLMTDAAADAARTRLPMINREYIFDEPGRIREVVGGGADATLLGGLSATDWAPE